MPTPNKPDDKPNAAQRSRAEHEHDMHKDDPKLASKAGPAGVEPADEKPSMMERASEALFPKADPSTAEQDEKARRAGTSDTEPKLASKAGPSGVERADESDFERAAPKTPEAQAEARKDAEEAEDDAGDDKPKRRRGKKEPNRLPYHRITDDGPLHVAFRDTRHGLDSRKDADADAQFRCHGCGSMIRFADLEAEPEPEKETAKK